MSHYANHILVAGARPSPLSKAQVQEIWQQLRQFYPDIELTVHYIPTVGDVDQATSLRGMDRTDFFTKEIDRALLNHQCRIGIHSAKDLPKPIPTGLKVICVTKGIDPADVLVLRAGQSLQSLPFGATIATSSLRREEQVRQLRQDFTFCDLRGTIEQRLAKLDQDVDGVVVAEAALIRLHLTHLNRIRLPGPTAEGQGQLAIMARALDQEMEELFRCLDSRSSSTAQSL